MSAEDERTWGAVSHAGAVVAMICSAGFLGFLASIAVYVIHKDRGRSSGRTPPTRSTSRSRCSSGWWCSASSRPFGLRHPRHRLLRDPPVFAVPLVIAGILHVIGAVKAYNGEWWNPPITPRFVK